MDMGPSDDKFVLQKAKSYAEDWKKHRVLMEGEVSHSAK